MYDIKLSRELYPKLQILAVKEVFSHLCNIEIIDDKEYYNCIFTGCVTDEELTVREFENYLIGYVRQYEF